MAATYEVGDKVKVNINDTPYYGFILTYDDSVDPIMYKVSVMGLPDVQLVDEDSIDNVL